MYSEKYLIFKYILPQFRLIFNSQKKKRKKERKTSVVHDEREAITPVRFTGFALKLLQAAA